MQLFLNNHFMGIFLKQNRSVFRDFSTDRNRPPAHLFMLKAFSKNVANIVFLGFKQGTNFQRNVTAQMIASPP